MATISKITRICEYCQQPFKAQKTTTRYCSHQCNQRGYKKRKKEEKVAQSNLETTRKIVALKVPIKEKDFLSVADVCTLLGISRWSVYRAIHSGRLKAVKFGRRTLISRQAIDDVFELNEMLLPEINIQINPSKLKS